MKKITKISFFVSVTMAGFLSPFALELSPRNDPTIQAVTLIAHAQQNTFNFDCNVDTLGMCIPWAMYNIFWRLSNWSAGLAGRFMDYFINYSIDSTAYGNSEFINSGWGLIRDLTNLVFIAAIIWLAVMVILGQRGGSKPGAGIIKIIGIALIVNFSLFFAKVVIDASNILARVFYTNIRIEVQDPAGENQTPAGQLPISYILTDLSDPQRLINSNPYTTVTNLRDADANTSEFVWTATLLVAVSTFLNFKLTFLFFGVGMLFVGRTIGLYFIMIVSPISVGSILIPPLAGSKRIGWKSWRTQLFELSFMAPIYVFFLYLAVLLISIGQTTFIAF